MTAAAVPVDEFAHVETEKEIHRDILRRSALTPSERLVLASLALLDRGQGTLRAIRLIAGMDRGVAQKWIKNLTRLGFVDLRQIPCPVTGGGVMSIYQINYQPSQEPPQWAAGTLLSGHELGWVLSTETSYADAILESHDPWEGK